MGGDCSSTAHHGATTRSAGASAGHNPRGRNSGALSLWSVRCRSESSTYAEIQLGGSRRLYQLLQPSPTSSCHSFRTVILEVDETRLWRFATTTMKEPESLVSTSMDRPHHLLVILTQCHAFVRAWSFFVNQNSHSNLEVKARLIDCCAKRSIRRSLDAGQECLEGPTSFLGWIWTWISY